jgi:hypothetical protein
MLDSIGKFLRKKIGKAAPVPIFSVFLEVEAVVPILNRIVLSMFDCRVSRGRRVRPRFKILWLVLDAILFHESSDCSLLFF